MSPIIREATKKDLPVLNSFMDALVDVERSMDTTLKDGKIVYYDLEGFIKSKHAILYVIELNTEIVASGYAKINLDKTYLKHDKHAYLGFMYVKEKHRGNGYNKLMLMLY